MKRSRLRNGSMRDAADRFRDDWLTVSLRSSHLKSKAVLSINVIRSCQVDTRNIQMEPYGTLSKWAGCFCDPEAERRVVEFSLRVAAVLDAYRCLNFWIRRFTGIGYWAGDMFPSASARTSAGALKPNLAWNLPSL